MIVLEGLNLYGYFFVQVKWKVPLRPLKNRESGRVWSAELRNRCQWR